jgi:hypothetical protein
VNDPLIPEFLKKPFSINIILLPVIILLLIPYAYANSGGTITNDGAYTIHTFTTNGTLVLTEDLINVSILVIAGGGAGGIYGGGGGAGEVNYTTGLNLTIGNYDVIVGSGGINTIDFSNGTSSNFSNIINTIGGNGGGDNNYLPACVASCGGGYTGAGVISPSISGHGHSSGNGASSSSPAYPTAGGAGCGSNGFDSSGTTGGDGGQGCNISISGSEECYAGGGGGNSRTGTAGSATCGGGAGGNGAEGSSATANTGAGGGGSGSAALGGSGGSGIIIIRYLTNSPLPLNVSILAPPNNTHIFIGEDVNFTYIFSGGTYDRYNCEVFIQYNGNISSWGYQNLSTVPNVNHTELVNLPYVGNYTFYADCLNDTEYNESEYRTIFVDAICEEDWVAVYGECGIDDLQLLTYIDNNQCGTYEDLPQDNGTYIPCNYCSSEILNITGDCEGGTQSVFFYDNNYEECCYITEIPEDCEVPYPIRQNCTIPEENITNLLCEANLTNDFNCEYDNKPILHNKMNVVCELPLQDYWDCVVNILQNGTLLSTSPEYREATDSILSIKTEGETRESFETTSSILNGYYTPKNLRTDTPFTLEIKCSNNTDYIISQYCIIPEYIKPDQYLNVLVWAKNNAALLIGFFIFISLAAFLIFYFRGKM